MQALACRSPIAAIFEDSVAVAVTLSDSSAAFTWNPAPQIHQV